MVSHKAFSTNNAERKEKQQEQQQKPGLKVFKPRKDFTGHDPKNLQSFRQIHSSSLLVGREKQASSQLIDWSQGEFTSRSSGLAYYGVPSPYGYQGTDPELRFLDPYDDQYKGRLINAFLFDPIINEAIRVRVSHLLGSAHSINFYPDTGVIYDSQLAAQQALSQILTDQEQKALRDFIFKVESKICKLNTYLPSAVIQSFVGGRSALYYETAKKTNDYGVPEGTPIAIKPLHFSYLGQVSVDPETWSLDSVEYKDNIFEKLKTQEQIANSQNYYIPHDRMIYFTREDEHMTPNDYFYGKSVIQPILSCSETLRYIIEEDLPEINKSQWAGTGFFEFSGMADEDIQEVLDRIEPGLNIGFNQPTKYTNIPAQGNAQSLTNQLTELLQFMLVKLKVPTFLMNHEQITNRATTDTVSQIWQITTLEQDRNWLRQTLQDQWYDMLIELFTGVKAYDRKYKIVIEFESKLFEDFLSKAQGVTLLLNAGVITRPEGREMLALGPIQQSIEGLSALNPMDQKTTTDMLSQINQQQQQQQQQQAIPTVNPISQAKTVQGLMAATAAIRKGTSVIAQEQQQQQQQG